MYIHKFRASDTGDANRIVVVFDDDDDDDVDDDHDHDHDHDHYHDHDLIMTTMIDDDFNQNIVCQGFRGRSLSGMYKDI